MPERSTAVEVKGPAPRAWGGRGARAERERRELEWLDVERSGVGKALNPVAGPGFPFLGTGPERYRFWEKGLASGLGEPRSRK